MNEAQILDYTIKASLLVLLLSLPPIVVATVVGVLVSLFQALTQVQEQTLGFAVKLIAVVLVLLLCAHWVGGELLNFTKIIFDEIARL